MDTNGAIIKSGILLPKSDILTIPRIKMDSKDEIFLNIYACLKKDLIWAEKGFAIAKEQFEIQRYLPDDFVIGKKIWRLFGIRILLLLRDETLCKNGMLMGLYIVGNIMD